MAAGRRSQTATRKVATRRRSLRTGRDKTQIRRVLRDDPGNVEALQALATLVRDEGHPERALQILAKAAAQSPDNPAIQCDYGNALKAAGRFQDAVDRHTHVARLLPNSAEAMSNLGAAYNAWGKPEPAIEWFRKAAEGEPSRPELRYNLGNALYAAGRFDEAIDAQTRTLELSPDHPGARLNLGIALREAGRLDAAIATLQTLHDSAPEFVLGGYSLSLALLMNGDYAAGWPAYEWRRDIPDFAIRRIDGPDWDGSPPDGSHILIHAEQALGDTIQFARYVRRVAALGADVSFLVPAPLKALLRSGGDVPGVIGSDETVPEFDLQVPLMSLPHLLGNEPPFVPPGGAYLSADKERVARWAARLAGPGRRIGIAWQGSAAYKADARRSVPLSAFEKLTALADTSIVCLQKGPGVEQLDTIGWRDRVIEPGPGMDEDGAFLDTAAIMAGLDLVITSDTSIAHLAGALGIETWVALAHVPDWRWGLAGEDCPWYPSMRLFRQLRPGDWQDVFARMAVVAAS